MTGAKADLRLYLRDARTVLLRAGLRNGHDNLPPGDPDGWAAHRNRLERVAEEAGEGA